MRCFSLILSVLSLSLVPTQDATGQEACGTDGMALQVLGSGGPFAGTDRASSSYLVWLDGNAEVMVDVGGGSFLRFGEAGAPLDDLSLLAISHLHPDHVSDLPALLWVSKRARRRSLPVSGPSGNDAYPDIATFINRMFDSADGAFPALAGTLGGPGSGVALDITTVEATDTEPSVVLNQDGLRVTAIGVPHMNAPTLAYRVQVGQRSIVFSSDQTGRDPRFVEFARGADILVMHFALSTLAPEAQFGIHATPTRIGQIARDAAVGRLVLSHLVQGYPYDSAPNGFSLYNLDDNVEEVRRYYSGPVLTASDLQCIPVSQ